MLIKAATKLADLQKEFLNEKSIFYKKVKELSDSNGRNLGLNTIQEIYLFLYFIGQGKNDTESKYSKKFIDMRSMTMQSWKGSIGQLLYKESKTVLNEDCQKIVENYEYLGDYVKMIDVYKDRFNQDTHKPFLDDNNIENLQKLYNYFCDNSVMNITLGDLQQEMVDAANDENNNNKRTKFVKWALKGAENENDGAFWFFMAIVLAGASALNEYHSTGNEIIMANVALMKLSKGENNNFNWYGVNKTFTGKDQTGENSINANLNDNRKNRNGSKIKLIDLKEYLENSINDENTTIPDKIDYKINEFFSSNKNVNQDSIKELSKKCNELIEYLNGCVNKGVDYMNSVENIVKEGIENNNQVIFTGAPGTGKTHSVRKYVKKFGEDRYKFVQFHPSYDYSDFIEGLRPVTLLGSSEPTFVRIDGVFKKFCRNIVDSNLSTIFKSWNTFNDDIKKKVLEMVYVINQNYDVILELININTYSNLRGKLKDLITVIGLLRKMTISCNDIENVEDISPNNESTPNDSTIDGSAQFTTSKDVKEKVNEKEWEVINNIINDNTIDLSINDNYDSRWYYFVIDEVNRADLSKVFGEIMFGLEESYRGIENRFDTQYMNLKTFEVDDNGNANIMGFDCFEKGFFIPRNIKFIGTMNDIDRSVESFDFALRRRFKWIDIKANEIMEESLRSIFSKKENTEQINVHDLTIRIKNMNNVLSGEGDGKGQKLGLNEAYHIGPAYFKEYKNEDDKDEESRKKYFEKNIESIIREYVRGRRNESIGELVKHCKEEFYKDNNPSSDDVSRQDGQKIQEE